MLDWFKKLMPKEEKFFDLFEAHAAKAQEAARSLRAIVEGGPDVVSHCKALSREEDEADQISYEVMQAIRRSFITPFDRSDIKALSSALDDAIDQMNKTGKTVMLYDVDHFEPNMKAMADKVIAMADLLAEGLPLMRNVGQNSAKLHALTGKLTTLEGESDDLNDKGLSALFKGRAKARSAGLRHRLRALRPPREGVRPLRGRGARDERHRHRARLSADRGPWALPSRSSC